VLGQRLDLYWLGGGSDNLAEAKLVPLVAAGGIDLPSVVEEERVCAPGTGLDYAHRLQGVDGYRFRVGLLLLLLAISGCVLRVK
jgi:hypothetical protein